MRITVSFDYLPIPYRSMYYAAIDEDTYDGAPDGKVHPIGRGATRLAAITDLAEQWDVSEYTRDELLKTYVNGLLHGSEHGLNTARFIGILFKLHPDL